MVRVWVAGDERRLIPTRKAANAPFPLIAVELLTLSGPYTCPPGLPAVTLMRLVFLWPGSSITAVAVDVAVVHESVPPTVRVVGDQVAGHGREDDDGCRCC